MHPESKLLPDHVHIANGSNIYARSKTKLPESGRATTHDFALADKLGVEFRSVEREVDIEVYAVKGSLGCVHAFKVLFEVLSRQI